MGVHICLTVKMDVCKFWKSKKNPNIYLKKLGPGGPLIHLKKELRVATTNFLSGFKVSSSPLQLLASCHEAVISQLLRQLMQLTARSCSSQRSQLVFLFPSLSLFFSSLLMLLAVCSSSSSSSSSGTLHILLNFLFIA